MPKINLSDSYCTYIIVRASSPDELTKKVNDIVEQGWQTEGIPGGGWQLVGGPVFDGKEYLQAMMFCPRASEARKINSE